MWKHWQPFLPKIAVCSFWGIICKSPHTLSSLRRRCGKLQSRQLSRRALDTTLTRKWFKYSYGFLCYFKRTLDKSSWNALKLRFNDDVKREAARGLIMQDCKTGEDLKQTSPASAGNPPWLVHTCRGNKARRIAEEGLRYELDPHQRHRKSMYINKRRKSEMRKRQEREKEGTPRKAKRCKEGHMSFCSCNRPPSSPHPCSRRHMSSPWHA